MRNPLKPHSSSPLKHPPENVYLSSLGVLLILALGLAMIPSEQTEVTAESADSESITVAWHADAADESRVARRVSPSFRTDLSAEGPAPKAAAFQTQQKVAGTRDGHRRGVEVTLLTDKVNIRYGEPFQLTTSFRNCLLRHVSLDTGPIHGRCHFTIGKPFNVTAINATTEMPLQSHYFVDRKYAVVTGRNDTVSRALSF